MAERAEICAESARNRCSLRRIHLCGRSLWGGLELEGELVYGRYVIEVGEIGVARQALTLFSVDQNFHFQNAGNVRGECMNQRGDGKFLDQNAGTVSIGKGGVEIDDREAGINQVHAANLGAHPYGMRLRLVEIKRKQNPKQFFCALL